MANLPSYKFTLIGPNEGKTLQLGNYSFLEGVYEHFGPSSDVELLTKVIGPVYNAWPDHMLADKRRELEEGRDAEPPHSATADAQAFRSNLEEAARFGAIPSERAKAIAAVAEERKTDQGLPANSSADEVAGGDNERKAREEGEGAPAAASIKDALKLLDPENDSHWTQAGLPAVGEVERLTRMKDVSRQAVTDVAPGFDRKAARDRKAVANLPTNS